MPESATEEEVREYWYRHFEQKFLHPEPVKCCVAELAEMADVSLAQIKRFKESVEPALELDDKVAAMKFMHVCFACV